MTTSTSYGAALPWWKEPTKDQWMAYVAAWLGWTLDAFDFTIFLLIMVPIAKEFHVPLTAVAVVFTITLWMRLVGAVASGWLADRVGRKTPADDLDPVVFDLQFHRRVCSRPSGSCCCSGHCSASAWVRNGRPARHWRWKAGRRARAGS